VLFLNSDMLPGGHGAANPSENSTRVGGLLDLFHVIDTRKENLLEALGRYSFDNTPPNPRRDLVRALQARFYVNAFCHRHLRGPLLLMGYLTPRFPLRDFLGCEETNGEETCDGGSGSGGGGAARSRAVVVYAGGEVATTAAAVSAVCGAQQAAAGSSYELVVVAREVDKARDANISWAAEQRDEVASEGRALLWLLGRAHCPAAARVTVVPYAPPSDFDTRGGRCLGAERCYAGLPVGVVAGGDHLKRCEGDAASARAAAAAGSARAHPGREGGADSATAHDTADRAVYVTIVERLFDMT
jgi:hypothetical protein